MPKLVFRDGMRDVPDHVRSLMSGIDTETLTFDEAIARMNRNLERRVIDQAADAVVKQHGRDHWGVR